MDNTNKIDSSSIEDFAEPAYLAYAMKVVKDRAIPDIQDGLKPVQRRIMYAMHQLKLLPQNSKPMKCARVVGDTIGKYHPHGDSSVYDAMVRMSQDFTLRYPLVHGEGNFGSRDGDSAAAMRYTEARLAPIAAALLDELSWDTVDFKPTYDNVMTEPASLPARLPFALLNGASGIAVGMATNLLSHNLNEVVEGIKLIINKKKTTLDDVLAVMPGPDFATGAKIISTKEEIKKVYEEGSGSLRVRSQWVFENYGKGNKDWRLVIKELPPDTSTAKIIIAINELMDPKSTDKNGKKIALKPEQLRLKKLFVDLIDEVIDASDLENPVSLIIEPKSRSVDKDLLTMSLCAHTDIEMNVSPNFGCVGLDGNPRQSGIMDWMEQWCEYRIQTVLRRLTDEKKRVDHRLHILNGRISILDKIEEVIKLLKSSKEPKIDLMAKFKLDEIQAEDVLEMRLRQLANLERIKILDEQTRLIAEQIRLAKLLSDDKSLRKMITNELNADVKQFGDDRRTELSPGESAVTRSSIASQVQQSLAPDPITVVLTERGWIAWRPFKADEEIVDADFKIKSGDVIKRYYYGDRSDNLLLISKTGRAYSLRLLDLPSKSDTAPLNQFFDLEHNDYFVEGAIAKSDDKFIVSNTGGYGFVVEAKDWINRMKAGKAFFTMNEDLTPLPPLHLKDVSPSSSILALSSDGKAVAFPLVELKSFSKSKGLGLIGLVKGETLSDITTHSKDKPAILRLDKKDIKISDEIVDNILGSRSSSKKGRALHKSSANTKFVRVGGF